MNHYELLVIITGTISDAELDGVRITVEGLIQKYTPTIHYMHNLGRRKLAYPIKHQGYGTYLLCEFDANPDILKKLERQLSLATDILRYCIVRRKTVGAPVQLERREDERPAKRTSRKAMGEELLDITPLAEEPIQPVSQEPMPTTPAKTEPPSEEAPIVSVQKETPPSEEAPKKKERKASYEELDKKLNELLSDDIL